MVTLLLVSLLTRQSNIFDFGAAYSEYSANEVRFQRSWPGKSANFEATIASVVEGRGLRLVVYPRQTANTPTGNVMWELMGSLFFVDVPSPLRSRVLGWGAGDLILIKGSFQRLDAVFKDEMRISGSTTNGFGYVSGGTVTVRTLIWQFKATDLTRRRSLAQILAEESRQAQLEEQIRRAQEKRVQLQSEFAAAIIENDCPKMRELIGLGVNYRINGSISYLMQAVEAQSYNATRLLLRLPDTDVNWKSAEGDTALLVAVRRNDVRLIELLKQFGAKEN